MDLGDKHNFGKQVSLVSCVDGDFYIKPRTVFWENLFFGSKSILKSLFEIPFIHANTEVLISNIWFNLDISINKNCGHSKKIDYFKKTSDTSDFFKFGCLIAYCYYFGIFDLHHQNVIPSRNGIQPIDAEVVLGSMTLPHEGLLLPFKGVDIHNCGAGHLCNNLPLDEKNLIALIEGFLKLSNHLAIIADEVIDTLSTTSIKTHPIRVIFRKTSTYFKHLNGTKIITDLSSAERLQLSRGDIPYFFKLSGDSRLFQYISSDLDFEETSAPDNLEDILVRMNPPITQLLDPHTILDVKLPRAILLLIKLMAPDRIKASLPDKLGIIENKFGAISFEKGSQIYKTK